MVDTSGDDVARRPGAVGRPVPVWARALPQLRTPAVSAVAGALALACLLAVPAGERSPSGGASADPSGPDPSSAADTPG
ncbi:MAG: hypothetical protein ACRD0R_17260, partial [Acidimicrobiales bacterium]